jgi:hypothetical protein
MYSMAYLFFDMVIAATLSGVAIKLSLNLAAVKITFFESIGLFLAFRVAMFMASKDSELTNNFVHFLSVERSKWALATMAVCGVMIILKRLCFSGSKDEK